MKKWYQGIVVEHKEIDNKMYHCFDDENFKILCDERNEQLKEIKRLHSIIKEVREYIEKYTEEKKSWLNGIPDYTVFKGDAKELLEILDKENK